MLDNFESKEAYLSDEDKNVEGETDPRSDDTTDGSEGDLVDGVAVVLPGVAETDVRQADGAPGEESSKRGQVEKPVEDDNTLGINVNVCENTTEGDQSGGPERTSGLVNVREDNGSVTLLGHGGEGARSTVDTGDTDRDNGDKNDHVHEVVETVETGIATDQDEGGGLGVGEGSLGQEGGVVRVDEQTDEEETQDVEEGDTPEDLLDGTGKRFDGVAGLSGSQTDQFSTSEGEGSCDEDGAETLEAVLERTRVVPVAGTPVLVVTTTRRTTTADKNERDDHEDDDGGHLEDGGEELFLGVTDGTKQVDDDDDDEEDGDPDSEGYVVGPVVQGDATDNKLKRQDNGPLEDIVPAHGKTPRGVDETSRVCVEATRDRVHNSEFTESEHGVEHHDTDDHEIDEQRTGSLYQIMSANSSRAGDTFHSTGIRGGKVCYGAQIAGSKLNRTNRSDPQRQSVTSFPLEAWRSGM